MNKLDNLIENKKIAAKAKREADEAFIAALPESTEGQLRKLVKALKSDDITAVSVGYNIEFKVTTDKGLLRVENAKKARVKALNQPTKKAEVIATVNGDMKILSWALQHKPVKDSEGNKKTVANLRYKF